jgi:hypothetical protein
MSEPDMVERVARALYQSDWAGNGKAPSYERLQGEYLREARAAIEAMKDIDPDLIEGPSMGFGVADWNITIDNILIDAALSGKE